MILTSEKNTIKNKNNKIARNNSNANIDRTSNNINRATNNVNSNRNFIKANTNDGVGGVKMKSSVNNLVVMESDEIHLNCGIKSNPNVSGVKWLFNGQEILTDPTQGKSS